jgi:hypothetical protein
VYQAIGTEAQLSHPQMQAARAALAPDQQATFDAAVIAAPECYPRQLHNTFTLPVETLERYGQEPHEWGVYIEEIEAAEDPLFRALNPIWRDDVMPMCPDMFGQSRASALASPLGLAALGAALVVGVFVGKMV